MAFVHEPVLLAEVLQWMNVRENGVYADGTLGGGGHSGAMLEASGGTATLYGIDRDENAIAAATARLEQYPAQASGWQQCPPTQFPGKAGYLHGAERIWHWPP